MSDLDDITRGESVDLTLFAGGEVIYKLTEVSGDEVEYVVPVDIPFRDGLGLMRCYDALMASMGEEDSEKWEAAWGKLLEALERILALRNSSVTAGGLEHALGASMLMALVDALIIRLQFQTQVQTIEGFLDSVLHPKGQSPETEGSAAPSGPSADITDGDTTTGETSAGGSSGPPQETSEATKPPSGETPP